MERESAPEEQAAISTSVAGSSKSGRAGIESDRPKLFDFRGVAMTRYYSEKFDKVENFSARPDDILIATYPKAGTTWVSHMLDQIYFGDDPKSLASQPVYERVPYLEICAPDFFTGVDLIDSMTSSPRLIKTHLPVQLVPKSFWEQKCRVIYVARNPKDNAVSYFHFGRMNKLQPEPGDWASYLERFRKGQMLFGSWYAHVKGWWEHRQNHPQLLYLFYEDLKEDVSRELGRVCDFLGVSLSEEAQDRVLREVGFQSMRDNSMTNYSTCAVMDHSVSPFMRKGMVGDWKSHFTVSQNEAFDEEYQTKMMDTTLTFRMKI